MIYCAMCHGILCNVHGILCNVPMQIVRYYGTFSNGMPEIDFLKLKLLLIIMYYYTQEIASSHYIIIILLTFHKNSLSISFEPNLSCMIKLHCQERKYSNMSNKYPGIIIYKSLHIFLKISICFETFNFTENKYRNILFNTIQMLYIPYFRRLNKLN